MPLKKALAMLGGVVGLPILAAAEQPFSLTDTLVVTASIEAIDHDARVLTLLDGDGDTSTIRCGPGVDPFDRLEVDDTVTFPLLRLGRLRRPPPRSADRAAGHDR